MDQDEAVLADAARRYARRGAGRWVDHSVVRWAVPVLALVIFLAVWDATVRIARYPTFILPAPAQVWSRFLIAWNDGTLWWHTRLTLVEIFSGLAIGVTGATILGYLIAKSATLDRLLSPYIVASQSVPVVALAPLLVIWFSFGPLSKILICALTLFFPVLVNTTLGIRSVSADLRALMQSLRADRWQTLTMLEIPAALPVLLSGLKIGVTLSVIGAVVGEFVGADRGLGFLLNLARGLFDTPLLFVALTVLVIIALTLYGLVSALERAVLKGRQ